MFYTNFNSKKGGELKENQKASMCFHWKSLRRQVRAIGKVEEVSTKEAVLHKIDDKLSFSSSWTAPDDYSFVGWQMRGEMLVDLSEDPLTSNKAAASIHCCCLT